MAGKVIRIKRGDADTLTETITGLSSLSGYTCKFYIIDEDSQLYDTLTGTVSGLTIAYEVTNTASYHYEVGTYTYETKIYDASDHVYTTSRGTLLIETASKYIS